MKEDAPAPKHPPRKRYQLEKAVDLHLAIWANDDSLPASERERAQEERERRKRLRPDRRVGLLVDSEGVTQPQFTTLIHHMEGLRPTEIHHPWASRTLNTACKRIGIPVVVHKDVRDVRAPLRAVVLASNMIIAAPRARVGTPAWEAMKYAKHRKLPLTIVLPDGDM